MLRIAVIAACASISSLGRRASRLALTLEQIMADPDWIAAQIELPEGFETRGMPPHFSVDGKAVYYKIKRSGSPLKDLHRIDLSSGADTLIDAAGMAGADGAPIVYDEQNKHAAFVRNGDVYIRDLHSGTTQQITRSAEDERSPQFSADGRWLSFRSDNKWFVHDVNSGVTGTAPEIKTEKDPDATPKADDLRDMQLRTFTTLKKAHDEKKAAREYNEAMQRGDATRAPLPFYIGDDVKIIDTALSPDTRWMLAVTAPKNHDEGRKGKLTRYVTESGYEESEDERIRVGRNDPPANELWLFDIAAHTQTKLGFDALPGVHDDPLRAIRDENAKSAEKEKPQQKIRREKNGRQTEVARYPDRRHRLRARRIVRRRSTSRERQQGSLDRDGRRFIEETSRATSPARSGMDQLELQRIRLGKRQPHVVVRVGRIRLRTAVCKSDRRRAAAVDARKVRGVASVCVGGRQMVLRLIEPAGALCV